MTRLKLDSESPRERDVIEPHRSRNHSSADASTFLKYPLRESHHSLTSSISMRLPSFPTLVRTLYAFSNATVRLPPSHKALSPFTRATVLKSMPSFPFIGSLFSSSAKASDSMSYPVQKSSAEWKAVLNKGKTYCLWQTERV